MSRYSPTVGPYQDPGGSFLGEYLDFLRTKQYYDYAREEMQLRREMQEQDRQMEKFGMALETPGLEYFAEPPMRSYKDPVLAGPSVRQGAESVNAPIPEDAMSGYPGLAASIQEQMAEPGKPVALAGELVPGIGFVSQNVYQKVPDPQYQEVIPNLYRDRGYDPQAGLAGEIGLWQQAMPGLEGNQALAEIIARDPNLAYSLPREMLVGEPSVYDRFRDAALEAEMRSMLGEKDFELWKRQAEEEARIRRETAQFEEGLFRGRPQRTSSTGGGTISLTQNPRYQAANRIMMQLDSPEDLTDEVARSGGFMGRQDLLDTWHGLERGSMRLPEEEPSPQTTIEQIIRDASNPWRGVTFDEFYRQYPRGATPTQPTTAPTGTPTRRRRGG